MHTCLEKGSSSWMQLVSIGAAQVLLQLLLVIGFNLLEGAEYRLVCRTGSFGRKCMCVLCAHLFVVCCAHVCVMWCVSVQTCERTSVSSVSMDVHACHSPEPCPAPAVPAAVQRMPCFSGTPFASRGHPGTVCWTVGMTEVAIVMS